MQMPAAARLADLSRPEHLLVWTMRAIALGNEDCPVVLDTFRRICGAKACQTLQAYGVFVKYVAMTARDRLRVHTPGCPCVGEDEAAVVAIIAAAQDSLHSLDEAPLKARLRELIGREPDEALLFTAQSIARLLAASGLTLPMPAIDRDEPRASAAADRVLH